MSEKACSSCSHRTVCVFRLKVENILNNHSHFFLRGSRTITGGLARLCRYYVERTVQEAVGLRDWEKECIIRALDETSGCRADAAALLGIGERTLYRKINQYNLLRRRKP